MQAISREEPAAQLRLHLSLRTQATRQLAFCPHSALQLPISVHARSQDPLAGLASLQLFEPLHFALQSSPPSGHARSQLELSVRVQASVRWPTLAVTCARR